MLDIGNVVILKSIPDGLLTGLPKKDQDKLLSYLGKPGTVVKTNNEIVLEFVENDDSHLILVSSANVQTT